MEVCLLVIFEGISCNCLFNLIEVQKNKIVFLCCYRVKIETVVFEVCNVADMWSSVWTVLMAPSHVAPQRHGLFLSGVNEWPKPEVHHKTIISDAVTTSVTTSGLCSNILLSSCNRSRVSGLRGPQGPQQGSKLHSPSMQQPHKSRQTITPVSDWTALSFESMGENYSWKHRWNPQSENFTNQNSVRF